MDLPDIDFEALSDAIGCRGDDRDAGRAYRSIPKDQVFHGILRVRGIEGRPLNLALILVCPVQLSVTTEIERDTDRTDQARNDGHRVGTVRFSAP